MSVKFEGRDHPQVQIQNRERGWFAWVDEGLAEVLQAMWELGLDTQYSCQGGPHWSRHEDAYVLMDRKSGQRFENLMKAKRNELSQPSQVIAGMFLDGPRMQDVSLAVRNVEYFRWVFTPQIALKIKPKPNPMYFSVERSYQLAPHWLRTTYRWPDYVTPYILDLLEELH